MNGNAIVVSIADTTKPPVLTLQLMRDTTTSSFPTGTVQNEAVLYDPNRVGTAELNVTAVVDPYDASGSPALNADGGSVGSIEAAFTATFMPRAPGELKKRLGLEGANGPDLDKWMRNVAAAKADTGDSSDLVVAPSQLAAARSPRARMLAARAKRIRSELARADSDRIDALLKEANELTDRKSVV